VIFIFFDKQDSSFHIDSECAECLQQAAKLAVSKVLAAVIKNELTDNERTVIQLHWFEGYKNSLIAEMLNVSPKKVRSVLKAAETKIYESMKYVVLYDNLVGCDDELPADFHFKIISCINGKELIS
jgi:DNA-directed RNA polymerase specialized sigma subunit